MKKLWEIEHPYYHNSGCYYSNDCHNDYDSFEDFREEWKDSDMDYNWIIRWDWLDSSDPDEELSSDLLQITFFMQRKRYPLSCWIKVTKDDLDAVTKFLTPYAEYMKEMWEPLMEVEK